MEMRGELQGCERSLQRSRVLVLFASYTDAPTWSAGSRPEHVEQGFSGDPLGALGLGLAGLDKDLQEQLLEGCSSWRGGCCCPQSLTCSCQQKDNIRSLAV